MHSQRLPASFLVLSLTPLFPLTQQILKSCYMFIMLEQKIGRDAQNVDFMKIKTLGDIYELVTELSAATVN